MGALTNDLTRLCGEIRSLRRARQALMGGLAQSGKERKERTREMRQSLARARAGLDRSARAGRLAFLSSLKTASGRRRQEFRDEMAGARRAWLVCSAAASEIPQRESASPVGAGESGHHGPGKHDKKKKHHGG